MRKGRGHLVSVAVATIALSPFFSPAVMAQAEEAAAQRAVGSITVTDQVIGQNPVSVAVGMEDVNHEIYGGIYTQMLFGEAFAEPARVAGISGMWRATNTHGTNFSLVDSDVFKGVQSQRITRSAAGSWSGIENRGLNRQGLSVSSGKPYTGTIVLRTDRALPVRVSFQNADGTSIYAAQTIATRAGGWQRYQFTLTPSGADDHARFAVEIDAAGTLDIGYALVEPGAWGRFKNVPVRADVGQALVDQGTQAIRFGGCANGGCGDVSDYKWKSMIGDPAQRPVTRGFWYPYESNGFGLFEFLQLGEALGVEAVMSLNIDETPEDIRDLMDYLYGSAATTWGARRIADGHPEPYKVTRIQLGNEEAVDDAYFAKFKAQAEVIWGYDRNIRLVVGDFTFLDVIKDPFNFTGGGKIKSLAAHQKILQLAAQWRSEVDFDVHLWTRTPDDGGWNRKEGNIDTQIAALDSYDAALRAIGPKDAKFKIVVFELNANSHDLTRALANAYAITALQRRPYVDVISSANAFQVDGHNDNGWNQGLIFMNQAKVWAQPPYYVHQMIAAAQQPNVLRTIVNGPVEATAFKGAAGLSLNMVNVSDKPVTFDIDFGKNTAGAALKVTTLGDDRGNAVNTSANPTNIVPEASRAQLNATGRLQYTLRPRSFTTMTTAR
ncbi:alpha-L-arabinofuranosidase C-terminal domain-containing protein [Hephaestia sp. GCM10023244]|uniref:alpha-L-arabinofuranosidase C-terminal domain-containing protein n=1 Tax=unclassified Hephaestia TaxID=2631281 RepID=UPI002077447F|nr:alpha-L-arabinofuranosidase C-terminal domain-containing protein [Hephaestia sp. MAHUQ-44]MCM8732449.1 hypothetical protein [Hephaestia sp. MAHUQ-44]